MVKNTKRIDMQPILIHSAAESDIVETPIVLASDMINYFKPFGKTLDPCAGRNLIFYTLRLKLEGDAQNVHWCEIERDRDFYSHNEKYDWIIGNPPYTHYSAWLRHSMELGENIVYLMPVYKIFASGKFLDELFNWGGIAHIRRYGTGSQWGFPFGHALGAVHYKKDYKGDTTWSRYNEQHDH